MRAHTQKFINVLHFVHIYISWNLTNIYNAINFLFYYTTCMCVFMYLFMLFLKDSCCINTMLLLLLCCSIRKRRVYNTFCVDLYYYLLLFYFAFSSEHIHTNLCMFSWINIYDCVCECVLIILFMSAPIYHAYYAFFLFFFFYVILIQRHLYKYIAFSYFFFIYTIHLLVYPL